jgi:hypothetical protein
MKRLLYFCAGACAAIGLVATPAVAGSGVGGVFNLGVTNSVNGTTSLTGNTAGTQLNVSNASSSGSIYGVFGKTTSASASVNSAGVRGTGSGSAAGIVGTQTDGIGVRGSVTGGTGVSGRASTGTGVLGVHASSGLAPGVEGRTSATFDIGASGILGTGTGTFGVMGETGSPGGEAGVMGRNSGQDQAGVFGCSDYGPASAFLDTCYFGLQFTHGGTGGFFIGAGHDYPNGRGVVAVGQGAQGIGIDATGAIAGSFHGNVNIQGTLSKTAGSFRIDNPLDPARSYLQHSFVESPDMKNVYDGIAVTDARGFATVRMPKWFQALNRTFRYQLTIVGRSFAQAIVWKPLTHNRFTIRTNKPRVKVSWQVTGIRHDPYADAHRIKVVLAKSGRNQGRYVYPEGYGKPHSLGVGTPGPVQVRK